MQELILLLFPWNPSKVVLLLVLLVSFIDLPATEDYQVLEYFAGVGRIAAFSKHCGYRSAALDIEYRKEHFQSTGKRSPMDINSDAGLMQLVWCVDYVVFVC